MAFQPKEFPCGDNRNVLIDTQISEFEGYVTVTAQEGTAPARPLFERRIDGPLLPLLSDDAEIAIGDCRLCAGKKQRKCTFQFRTDQIATGWLTKITRNR